MDRALRWKTIILATLALLSGMYLLPSTNAELPSWYSQVFSNKVQLGLDLQGGWHIVYGIDLDKTVDDKAGEIRRDMEQKLVESQINAKVETPRSPLGAVYLTVNDAADKGRIDDKFLEEYREFLGSGTIPCPK